MLNAELVAMYQKGDAGVLLPLWEQTQRFITKQAARVIHAGACGVELCDLEQVGFLAMIEAAATYDADCGASFVTWLGYHLKKYFALATGVRSGQRDALNGAASLDEELFDDNETITRGDTVSDPQAEIRFREAEERVWIEQLHNALEKALGALPERDRAVILDRYYNGLTLAEVGAKRDVTANAIRQTERQALTKMRRSRAGKELEKFVDSRTRFDYRVGVDRFNRTHTSGVEEVVFYRDKLRNKYIYLA